jgi:hypothetical protein
LDIAATITYQDIFGHTTDEETIRADAQALSLNDCLQSLGKLSHLLAADETAQANSFMLGGLRHPGAVMLTMGMLRVGRPLVFGKRLLAAARVAILEAEERDPDSFENQRDLHRFVRLILGVADVFDQGDAPEDPKKQTEWLSSLLLKRVGLPQRSFYSSVVRSMRVFVDLPTRRPELLDKEAPSVAFEREVGLTLERYLAICFAVAVRFRGWNKEPDAWLLDATYFRNSRIDPQEFRLAARTFSATVADLRNVIERDVSAGFNTIDDIWPFITNPLIEIEQGVYVTVDVETLGDALTGDGLYWRMKYNPGASTKERENLGAALGHLVEAHCYEVAVPCFAAEGAGVLFPEVAYRKVVGDERRRLDGPDLAIFEGTAGAVVEIGIDRPNMLETIVRGDLASFDGDVEDILLHRAEQLSRKIDDFLNGHLIYAGVSSNAITRIHPVICLIDGFPAVGPLYDRVTARFAQAGLLQQPNTEPVAILSVEEFEYLCALVEEGKQLTAILRDHARSAMSRDFMRDYLIKRFGRSPQPPSVLQAEFATIGDRFAKQLFGKTLPQR